MTVSIFCHDFHRHFKSGYFTYIYIYIYIYQENHKYLSQDFGLKRHAELWLKVTDGLIVMNGDVVIFIFQKHPLQ